MVIISEVCLYAHCNILLHVLRQIVAQITRLQDRPVFYGLLGAIVIALGSTTGPLIGKYDLKLFDIILLIFYQTGGALTGNRGFLCLEELHSKSLFQNDYLGVGAFISISQLVVSLGFYI